MAVRVLILLCVLCPVPALAGEDGVSAELLERIASEEVPVRLAAVRDLAAIGGPGAPHLVSMITDDELDVRYQAKKALLRLGKDAVPALVEGLATGEPSGARVLCAEIIGRLGEDAKPALPALAAAMGGDGKDRVRQACAEALGRLGPIAAKTADALLKASQDEELQVRRRAIPALGKIGPAGVPGLVEVFRDGKRTYRDDVVEATLAAGEPMLPALLALLRDENAWTRVQTARLIGRIEGGSDEVVNALREACGDEDARVACEAAGALWGRERDAEAVYPVLLRGLRSEDFYARGTAVSALARIGQATPEVAEALADAIRRPDTIRQEGAVSAVQAVGTPAVRAILDALETGGPGTATLLDVLVDVRPVDPEAVPHLASLLGTSRRQRNPPSEYDALVAAGAPAAVPHLVRVLESGEPKARSAATRVLRNLGETASPAVPALRRALEVEGLRLDSAEALIAIGEIDPALPVLIETLDSKDRGRALDLIRRVPVERRPPAALLEPWLAEGTSGSRREAALAWWEATGDAGPALKELVPAFVRGRRGAKYELAKIGGPAVKPLTGLLEHEKSDVRRSAAMTLGEIGPEAAGAVPALTARLDDDGGVRYQVAVALGRIGPASKGAVPEMLELLRTGNKWIREAVLGAVPLIDPGAEGLRAEVERALESGVPDVRIAGALCLWRISGEADRPVAVLVDTLEDPDILRDAKCDASRALAAIGPPAAAAIPTLMAVRLEPQGVDALYALSKIAPESPEVRAALLEGLESEEPLTRAEAAWALREMGKGARFALAALERVANDTESYVRLYAREALEKIRGN